MPAPKRRTSSNEQDTAEKQKRAAQLEQINEIVMRLEQEVKQLTISKKQLVLLDSVSKGLYDEIDKLSKKAPAETVTDLVLIQINEIIRETKELMTLDPYMQKLKEFVAAGDNPQHRDAVVVLRQIRQGFERFEAFISKRSKWLESKYETAKGIKIALQLYSEGNKTVDVEDINYYGADISHMWIKGTYPKYFDFQKLDIVSLETYFEEQ